VIDFGLAKAIVSDLDQRTLFTESGQIVGTPEYMSPEQARGAFGGNEAASTHGPTSTRWAFVLYELISGSLPFDSRELRGSGIAGLERMNLRCAIPRDPARG
jgi:serine/threonine-protein kinase